MILQAAGSDDVTGFSWDPTSSVSFKGTDEELQALIRPVLDGFGTFTVSKRRE